MGGRSLFSNDDGNGGGKRYKDEGGVLVCLYAMDILWMRCGGRGRDWIGVGGLSEMILRKASCRCRRLFPVIIKIGRRVVVAAALSIG